MPRPESVIQDIRHALRLASLGFGREAEAILVNHQSDPAAALALATIEGASPVDARRALCAIAHF